MHGATTKIIEPYIFILWVALLLRIGEWLA
jgi:hypothetical protein